MGVVTNYGVMIGYDIKDWMGVVTNYGLMIGYDTMKYYIEEILASLAGDCVGIIDLTILF
jgi:hypothetical protein